MMFLIRSDLALQLTLTHQQRILKLTDNGIRALHYCSHSTEIGGLSTLPVTD